jgi:two-component system phosphate regulon sensor histidine kinase PhoR
VATYEIATILGEAERVEQVLVNLLENAIKYTPASGQLQVRWSTTPKGSRLHVVDNGPGIPAEHQSRLFERFYRVDQARSRELGGTGLGLAIVKHIMQRQGGSTWVVSEPGKGAEFICQFPNP